MKEKTILNVKDLSAAYEDAEVLSSVNLSLKKGEMLCIVGESGSGKSTLLRTVCGDAQIKVKNGCVIYGDRDITKLKSCERQKVLGTKIGYIQQNPWGAFNPLRPYSIQFRETLKSHKKKYDAEKIAELFSILGLKDPESILKSRPYEMSGGMNQRIAIAASFILGPELLLCDEITSALDVTTASAVTDELLKLKKETEVTIVMVTHNIGIAANIADRIAIMYKGQIVECGERDKIINAPEHEYTKRLLADVPQLEY